MRTPKDPASSNATTLLVRHLINGSAESDVSAPLHERPKGRRRDALRSRCHAAPLEFARVCAPREAHRHRFGGKTTEYDGVATGAERGGWRKAPASEARVVSSTQLEKSMPLGRRERGRRADLKRRRASPVGHLVRLRDVHRKQREALRTCIGEGERHADRAIGRCGSARGLEDWLHVQLILAVSQPPRAKRKAYANIRLVPAMDGTKR